MTSRDAEVHGVAVLAVLDEARALSAEISRIGRPRHRGIAALQASPVLALTLEKLTVAVGRLATLEARLAAQGFKKPTTGGELPALQGRMDTQDESAEPKRYVLEEK